MEAEPVQDVDDFDFLYAQSSWSECQSVDFFLYLRQWFVFELGDLVAIDVIPVEREEVGHDYSLLVRIGVGGWSDIIPFLHRYVVVRLLFGLNSSFSALLNLLRR